MVRKDMREARENIMEVRFLEYLYSGLVDLGKMTWRIQLVFLWIL